MAIYGAGDAAVQVVNFLLLPLYVKGAYLTKEDYGALALLIGLEAIARVFSKWGVDGAFMRLYHERSADGRLPQLASTIVWFLLGANLVVFGAAIAAAGWIGAALFDDVQYVGALRLMLVNAWLMSVHVRAVPSDADAQRGGQLQRFRAGPVSWHAAPADRFRDRARSRRRRPV